MPSDKTTREARPDELPSRDGYDTWGVILESESGVVGRIFMARQPNLGQIFGFDAVCDSEDKHDYARLFKAACRKVRELGQDRFFVHIDETTPQNVKDFWVRLGARPVLAVLEVGLK